MVVIWCGQFLVSEVGRVLGYSEQFVNSEQIYYTIVYQIYHRNGPVSRTFGMRIEKFEVSRSG